MNENILTTREQDTEEHWISISDMMAGLMVIFLFIAISYMLHVQAEQERIEQVAVTYEKLQADLYDDLDAEFRDDFKKWNAGWAYEDEKTNKTHLTIRFKEPDVLFDQGSAEVRPVFEEVLKDFFPRYIRILRQPKYKNEIAEIRIEGHTSREWKGARSPEEAYIENMKLSQGRTRSVLKYVLQTIGDSQEIRDWLKLHLTANGLSSSKLITVNGIEDKKASRRVEFRVRTNAEKRIVEIINRGKEE